MKDILAAGEAFSSQKRTFALAKHEISYLFLLLWVIYALWIRIRILNMDSDPDPTDQRQCESESTNTASPPLPIKGDTPVV